MQRVFSQDGTQIAYDVAGDGPALILVGGALSFRGFEGAREMLALLAPRFTVINFDRRGRGDSGDTLPYAVEREVEDIEALIDAAGGTAYLYGTSSGAVLALEAASRLPDKVRSLLMYEPPLILDDRHPPVTADYVQRLERAVAEGRRGDAVALFMTEAVGVPEQVVAAMRYGDPNDIGGNGNGQTPPEWAGLEKVAHTLLYDQAVAGPTMRGESSLPARWAQATMPVLVVVGSKSAPFFHSGAQTLVEHLPNAQYRVLEGQDHAVAPAAISRLIAGFFIPA